MRTVVVTLIVAFIVVGTLISAVTGLGLYDVAATTPDSSLLASLLHDAMESSVERRARDIQAPDLSAPGLVETGLVHYHEMCVTCHGAPGVPASEIGAGLNPSPPELVHEAEEWSEAELFWMTKHGIKMTGMPAFGPTHTDEDIWAIVALMKRLPEMTPEQYAAMVEQAGLGPGPAGGMSEGGHSHAPGTAPHEH